MLTVDVQNSDVKILIACEESQTVCTAFRELGYEAYSCDLQEQSGGYPEWHIICDVSDIIDGGEFQTSDGVTHYAPNGWDLIIAHPPCTYLSNAGACRMYPTKGNIDPERYEKAMLGRDFFMKLWNADCEHIAIENPRPLKCVELPQETQRIQPYQFGEPWSKMTYLWLKNLPPLAPTQIIEDYKPYVSCGTSRNKGNPDKAGKSRAGGAQKVRSKTFPGIANAMALQWGSYLKGTLYERKV